jgi:hypothetical protein
MSTKGMPQASHEFHTVSFDDPRNITVGSIRIIWAKAVGHRPEGWCLPGGLRTTNRVEAHAAAMQLERLCSEAEAV